ncbi:MAG: hypothetical protein J1G38_02705 [Clostridiales bacterium]|nr:hypothetical protein [Clostridiales bacterium]
MIKQNIIGMLSLVDENFVGEADPTQRPKQRLGWKKLTAIAASVCVFVSALALSIIIPTMNNDKPSAGKTGLEWGFVVSSDDLPSEWCAYKSDTDTFDIYDVTLEFYFGTIMPRDVTDEHIDNELENGSNIPEFDIYFGNSHEEPLYTVRHSTENFISKEYSCYIEDYYSKETKIVYNHSERITIPQELFTSRQGVISFCIAGVNINEYEPKYKVFTRVLLNYDIVNGKVVLSAWDGRRE